LDVGPRIPSLQCEQPQTPHVGGTQAMVVSGDQTTEQARGSLESSSSQKNSSSVKIGPQSSVVFPAAVAPYGGRGKRGRGRDARVRMQARARSPVSATPIRAPRPVRTPEPEWEAGHSKVWKFAVQVRRTATAKVCHQSWRCWGTRLPDVEMYRLCASRRIKTYRAYYSRYACELLAT